MNRGEVSTSGCVRAGLEVPPDGSTKPGMGLAATPGCCGGACPAPLPQQGLQLRQLRWAVLPPPHSSGWNLGGPLKSVARRSDALKFGAWCCDFGHRLLRVPRTFTGSAEQLVVFVLLLSALTSVMAVSSNSI